MKFKVGDRVKGVKDIFTDYVGTIIYDDGTNWKNLLVEFDQPSHAFHDGDGKGKDGHCFWVGDCEITLINDKLDKLQRKLEKHENKVKEIKEKIKELNKIEVGDTVKVINHDYTYSTFYKWVEREISDIDVRYCFDMYHDPENGFICEVLHIAKHSEHLLRFVNDDTLAYVKHLDTGRCYLISVDGLEKC